jgi:hypothetical protein
MTPESILEITTKWAQERFLSSIDAIRAQRKELFCDIGGASRRPEEFQCHLAEGVSGDQLGVTLNLTGEIRGAMDAETHLSFWITPDGRNSLALSFSACSYEDVLEPLGCFDTEDGLLGLLDAKCCHFFKEYVLEPVLFQWLENHGFLCEATDFPVDDDEEAWDQWIFYEATNQSPPCERLLLGISGNAGAGVFEEDPDGQCRLARSVVEIPSGQALADWLDKKALPLATPTTPAGPYGSNRL